MRVLLTFDLNQYGNRASAEQYLRSLGFTNQVVGNLGPFRLPNTTWVGNCPSVSIDGFRDQVWADFVRLGCWPTHLAVAPIGDLSAKAG